MLTARRAWACVADCALAHCIAGVCDCPAAMVERRHIEIGHGETQTLGASGHAPQFKGWRDRRADRNADPRKTDRQGIGTLQENEIDNGNPNRCQQNDREPKPDPSRRKHCLGAKINLNPIAISQTTTPTPPRSNGTSGLPIVTDRMIACTITRTAIPQPIQ